MFNITSNYLSQIGILKINILKQHKHEENSTFIEYGQWDMSCSYK